MKKLFIFVYVFFFSRLICILIVQNYSFRALTVSKLIDGRSDGIEWEPDICW